MDKKIEKIKVNTSFVKWICKELIQSHTDGNEHLNDELWQYFMDMLGGQNNGILIQMEGSEDINILSDMDESIYKDLVINRRTRKVTVSGNDVNLTPKEFDILYFLYTNRGEIFTKEQIYQAVWDDKYLLSDSNIMSYIRKLRKKIEPYPDDPEYIITVWGIGYKFNDN